jgi:hypothetical protein
MYIGRIQVIVATPICRLNSRWCWCSSLDKQSAPLGLVQDEPALRAGAARGILDKTRTQRSVNRTGFAGGRFH